MRTGIRALGALIVTLCVAATPAWAIGLNDKVNLQASMQRHIDTLTVNGAYLHFDPAAGEVQRLHPVTAHPVIMQMGDNFVLCFDFKDDAGKDVAVDFYMARKGKSFVVFHAAVSNRQALQKLMKAGKVTRAE